MDATDNGAETLLDEKLDQLFETNPPPEPKDTQEDSEVEEEQPEQDDQETEIEEEPKGETDEEVEEEETEEAEEAELTLAELADIWGIDEDKLDLNDEGQVVLKTKIDGEEGKVSLADALKSYQLEGHLNKQNMEVVEQRKAIEAERQQFQQEQNTKLQQLEEVLTLNLNDLNSQFQGIDWQALERDNPNEYLILKDKYQERQAKIQQSHQLLQAEKQKSLAELRNREMEMMFNKVPEWKDEKAFSEARKEIINGASDYGFNSEEVSNLLDHRALLVLKDAIAYRKQQNAKPDVVKKVRAAPKIAKPGATKPTATKETSKQKAIKLIKKTGGEKGLDEYLDTIL